VVASLIGTLVLLLAASVVPVAADAPAGHAAWGTPTAVTEVNTAAHDGCPIESPNGKELFIASTRTGGFGKNDIWVAERPNPHGAWGPMVNLGPTINTAYHEFCPTPLGGGWLLFVSDRPACGANPAAVPPAAPVGDIYLTRQLGHGTWADPQHLGCVGSGGPNFTGGEFGPSLVTVRGEAYLYFSSTGTNGNHDIYRSRLSPTSGFGVPENVTELNSAGVDQMPNVSADGTEIVFASNRADPLNMDIWTSTMDPSTGLWSAPVPVTAVNTAAPETRPSFSGDGTRLYFGRGNPADIYVSTRAY
jgi:hypothetical protein